MSKHENQENQDYQQSEDQQQKQDPQAQGHDQADQEGENEAQAPAESVEEQLSAQLAAQKDKYMRLMAEFENYKRRTAKERIELFQTAGKDIVISLLDVMDDLDRAEKQMENDTNIEHVKEGSLLVFNKLRKTMEGNGLKAFNSLHEEFDVEKQEAIAEVPGNPELSGKVIDEIQKGYLLNDKLIRFAKVVVGK